MVKYGEIYALGNHRLMCGDATSREDVMRLIGNDHVDLVLTDPPYGMKAQDKHGIIGHVENRGMTGAKDERFANTQLSVPYDERRLIPKYCQATL